jgi:hypothetical protein
MLHETGSIRGSARLEGESDASGIRVWIPGLDGGAITNAAGEYLLEHIPPYDDFSLACGHPGFEDSVVAGMAVMSGLQITMPPVLLTRKQGE